MLLVVLAAAGLTAVLLSRRRRPLRSVQGPGRAGSTNGGPAARLGTTPDARRASTPSTASAQERRARSDPEALQALIEGNPSRVGFDLGRLAELKESNYKPLMEYLQYIQVQRGDSDTLVFVRMRDLDELAALSGHGREEFVQEFKKLGVMLSMN